MLIPWADPPAPPSPPEPDPARAPEPPPPDPLREIERLQLGIAQSPHDTDNWIGFAEPTPHSAPPSEVDQPDLDPNAGTPGTPGPIAAAASEPQQQPGPPSPPPAPPPAPPTARTEPQPDPAPPNTADLRGESPEQPGTPGEPEEGPDDPTRPLIIERAELPPRTIDESDAGFIGPPAALAESVPPALQTPPAPPTPDPQSAPIANTQGGSNNPGDAPGERSDRESHASSREQEIEVRPGRPAAAEGLEIITRRPQFSRVTRLLSIPPRNPRLRITFDRTGVVRNVEFLEPTGIPDVDDPVQLAVYRWTARGRALTELPIADPKAGVTITVTILLR